EAEELEVQVMETIKRVLGAEHPSTLTSMDSLASTYSKRYCVPTDTWKRKIETALAQKYSGRDFAPQRYS
ncbi:hypothetical protein DM02DRAFT_530734, partial [Periconia macrospinosa]